VLLDKGFCCIHHMILAQHCVARSQGRIRNDGSGLATFEVKYNCLVFRPFKGEVLDAVVTDVNKVRSCLMP
jgi:DNA-directed RNA polymerase subunit E'/Rpb7